MRTTLDLPDEIFRKLKAEAALRGFKLKELVAQFIERGLAADAGQPPPPGQRSAFPVAIARDLDTPMTPVLTNEQLHSLLEEEDLAQYRRVFDQPPE
jgi:hypothetical protein